MYKVSLNGLVTKDSYTEEDAEVVAGNLKKLFDTDIEIVREVKGTEYDIRDNGKLVLRTTNVTLAYIYGELRSFDTFSEMNVVDVVELARKLTDVYMKAKVELNFNSLVDFAVEKGILYIMNEDTYDIIDLYLGEGYDNR